MKKLGCPLLLWWVGLFCGSPLAAGESVGAEAVRQAKINEAAFRSVQESIGQLEKHQMSPEQLATTMYIDPGAYPYKDASEDRLRELERQRLREAVREQLAVFAGSRTDLPADWVRTIMADEKQRIHRTVDALLTKSFGDRYDEARALAVERQSVDFEAAVRPKPSEIELVAGPRTLFVGLSVREIAQIPKEHGQDLVRHYTDQIIADRQPFEENKEKIEERVIHSIAGGLEELWRQLRTVNQHDGGGPVERSTLEQALVAEVGLLRGNYGVFPSVRAFAKERAWDLENSLFHRYLEKQLDREKNCPGLPRSKILEGMPGSANQVPISLDAHVRQRVDQLQSDIQKLLLEPWVARVDDLSLKVELRDRLKAEMISGRTVFSSALDHCIRPVLDSYRQDLAARELAQVWPEVADSTYELSDGVLRLLHENDSLPKNVDKSILMARPLRLDESRALFEERRQELIEEGRTAIDGQVALVLGAERRRRFQESIRADGEYSEARRRHWQSEYEREVLGAWEERRQRLTAEKRMLVLRKYDRILDLTRKPSLM